MNNNVSASSAKDNKVIISEMALAMQADAQLMTDEEYEALRAEHGYGPQVPSTLVLGEQQPLRISRYGLFIAGLWAGAAILAIIAFVTQVSGPVAGIAIFVGVAISLGVIGVQLKDEE